MTYEQFQSKVLKVNWYDKYYYYFLYAAVTGFGFFLFYDVTANHAKYDRFGTRYLGYFCCVFLIVAGIRGLFLVPNRYKILSVNSLFTIDKNKEIIQELLIQLGEPYCSVTDSFYSFTYKKNWWTIGCQVYLSIDLERFYISVQSRTGGYYGGGIIDFGGTEKVRQKIFRCLTDIVGRH